MGSKLHYQGEEKLPDGTIREGNFVDDKLWGEGKERLPDGTIREGKFMDGKLWGEGKETLPDGTIREGNFMDGKLHNQGEEKLPDGTIRKGNFVHGQLYGKGEERDSNGVIKKGYFIEDKAFISENIVDSGYFIEDKANIVDSIEASSAQPELDKPAIKITIDTEQVHSAGSCCAGFGCCVGLNDFFYPLQYLIVKFIENCLQLQEVNMDRRYGKTIRLAGFGTSVFGNKAFNVFLNPPDIKPEEVAFFLKTICVEKDVSNMIQDDQTLLTAISASSFSVLALHNSLERLLKSDTPIQENYAIKVAEALKLPVLDSDETLKLLQHLKKLTSKVVAVNPPGILFAAFFPLDLKTQSFGVGNNLVACEEYFTDPIKELLGGTIDVRRTEGMNHSGYVPIHTEEPNGTLISKYLKFNFHDIIQPKKPTIVSSINDDMVLPFVYMAEFAQQLKNIGLDDETISKLVYKAMQFCHSENDIDTLLKDLNIKLGFVIYAKNIAEHYLRIRADYIEAQTKFHTKKCNWEEFKTKTTNIFKEHQVEKENIVNLPSQYCKPSHAQHFYEGGYPPL